ncbi:MAG: TonB family protein, partial [Alistipes sp.]|nr:TonB family protein [Alistipes sp.]
AALLAVAFRWVTFGFSAPQRPDHTICVESAAPRPARPRPTPPADEPRTHDEPANVERSAQVSGDAQVSRSPNPRALFNMSKSGSEPADTGNPHAREGQQQDAGKGPGSSYEGLDQVDKGLQGRGLVGNLPRPAYPGSQSGKIVVRVAVGPKGNVTSAVFEPKGSTVSDPQLIEAAIAAARKARFTESSAAVQGGTITYVFRME